MCVRAMYHKERVGAGSHMIYTGANGKIIAGRWGMFQSSNTIQINVQVEAFASTWKSLFENRGILEVDGFFEAGYYFHGKEGTRLRLPVLFDENFDFAVATKPARDLVKTVHKRQPILIDQGRENTWIQHGRILQINEEGNLFMISEKKLKSA